MDTIYLEDLRIDTIVGIYDWERENRQTIALDITMSTDIQAAANTDAIAATLNYKQVAKRLIQYIRNSQFQLIETLAERVAEIILYEFQVEQVKLRVNKPGAVRYSKNVGIEISRTREAIQIESVYLSMGSNIAPEQNITSALAMLNNEFGELAISTIYRNKAVGFAGDDFYNLVVGLQTALPVERILPRLSQIENMHGRDRTQPRFSARSLDIDMLLYGQHSLQQGKLILPRPDITEYAFVLKPLAELAPNILHPTLQQNFAALWQQYAAEHAADLTPITLAATTEKCQNGFFQV